MSKLAEELRSVAYMVHRFEERSEQEPEAALLESFRKWRDGGSDPRTVDAKVDELSTMSVSDAELNDMIDADLYELMSSVTRSVGSLGDNASPHLKHVPSYLPDALVPGYHRLMAWLVDMLVRLQILAPQISDKPDLAAAQEAYETANGELSNMRSDLRQHERRLDERRDKFGRENEFMALDGTCIQRDMGSYTYELCFGGSTTQISNNDGYRFNLGHFDHFDADHQYGEDDDRHYLTMKYEHGQTCWNGPARSTHVTLECGKDNELLDVFEAEKCLYSMRVMTPAVCFPVKAEQDKVDEAHIDHNEL